MKLLRKRMRTSFILMTIYGTIAYIAMAVALLGMLAMVFPDVRELLPIDIHPLVNIIMVIVAGGLYFLTLDEIVSLSVCKDKANEAYDDACLQITQVGDCVAIDATRQEELIRTHALAANTYADVSFAQLAIPLSTLISIAITVVVASITGAILYL